MSVTTTCRDVAELLSVAQQACKLLFQECFKAGVTDIFITETYRSKERQAYLYAQGRTRPGNIVTWTLNSNHASRLAWDIAVAPPKSLYDAATLNKVGAIARKLGITWGGDWTSNIDRPHFEVKSSWKMPTGYKFEGTVVIPTSSKERVKLILDDKEEVKVSDNKPSEWAKSAWEKAVKAGVFDGTNPKEPLTREQFAVVLDRLGLLD